MYFSIFYVFFKYLPRKKKKRGSIRLYTASTPAHGSCVFPKQSIRFSRKKTVFIKFSLAFFCHSGMLGKYFPFAAGSVLPVTPAAYNFPTARLQQTATFYPTENRFTDR